MRKPAEVKPCPCCGLLMIYAIRDACHPGDCGLDRGDDHRVDEGREYMRDRAREARMYGASQLQMGYQ